VAKAQIGLTGLNLRIGHDFLCLFQPVLQVVCHNCEEIDHTFGTHSKSHHRLVDIALARILLILP